MMKRDLLAVIEIATIVEDPDTTLVSAQLPTKEEKTHLKGEAKERNHHQEREGVEMIVMNEDPLIEQGFVKEEQVIKELHKTKTSSSCW